MDRSKSAGDCVLGDQAIRQIPPFPGSSSAAENDQATTFGSSPLPSFFIVGPPRTGTSWLHEVLRQRSILPAPLKETRFFDVHFHRGIEWYLAHYRRSGQDRLSGEVAPTYFASSAARERLVRTVPDAKVICIFRDPVQRLLSHYRIKRAYGMIPWNFEDAIFRDAELVESNRYAAHFKEWQRTFGPDQVVATLYDDLRDEPQAYVDRLADIVGMPRFPLTAQETLQVHSSKNMTLPRIYPLTRSATLTAEWCKARRLHTIVWLVKSSPLRKLFLGGGSPFPDPPPESALRLYQKFTPLVEELEAVMNRDLSAWKSPPTARRAKQAEIA